MKKNILFQGLAGLAAWGCLSGLALVRFWAVLYGHIPGELILAAAVVLSGVAVLAVWKLGLVPRLLLPFGPTRKTALAGGAAFALGALLTPATACLMPVGCSSAPPPSGSSVPWAAA